MLICLPKAASRPACSFQLFCSVALRANGVRDAVASLVKAHSGISIAKINNSVGPVQESYDVSMSTLLEGVLLAAVAVFLPTAFVSGISGQFFKQFGWTAAVAVMALLLPGLSPKIAPLPPLPVCPT